MDRLVPLETREHRDYQRLFSESLIEDDVSRNQMEQTWKKRFPTVMPKAVVLTPTDSPMYEWVDKSLESGEMEIDQVYETGYYVPFLPALEQFLNIKTVHEEVQRSFERNHTSPVEVYKDVWDGKLVKQNPIFIKLNGDVLGMLFVNFIMI